MNKDLKATTAKFPEEPGIYKFFNNDEVLYIGKAKNLKKRARSYFSGTQTYKTKRLVSLANKLDFVTTNNEVDALLLEQNLIKSEKPRFNILLIIKAISILIKNQPKKRWANMFLLIKTLLITK